MPAPKDKPISFGGIFIGAGFPLLAAEWAGIKPMWAIEPRPYFSQKTFRYNFPNVLYSTELNNFFYDHVDVIWGSPSCGEISSSARNSRNTVKMASKDFEEFEYVEFIEQVKKRRPKIFVLENIPSVKNFVRFEATPSGFVLKHQLTKEIVDISDYYIEEHQILPTEVGIPQVRNRLFIIGSRLPNRFMFTPPLEDKRKELSIQSIFEEIEQLRKEGFELHNDTIPKHSEEKIEKMSRVRQGEGLFGGMNNKRLDETKCSPVIMSHSTRYIHPHENRLLTARESACLMGVPLDFQFFGSENSQLDQIGKGIIPQVGLYILSQVEEFLQNLRSQ
jgi:DNA (cytosine-5)-methyltransferase 1